MSEHPTSKKTPTTFGLIITSDTRTEREDETGSIAIGLIEGDGHRVASHTLVPNNEEKIRAEHRPEKKDDTASSQESQLIIRTSMTEMGDMIRNALIDMNRRMDELENFNSKTVQKASRWYLLSFCIFIVFIATGIGCCWPF